MIRDLLHRLAVVIVGAGAAVLFILHRERTAQAALRRAAAAERTSRLAQTALTIKEAQHEASSRAAHTEPDLLDRLRAGSF
jgi:hypothetical protein